ncbi:class II aldolase/adducin family protein [Kribbella solani]|uniref:class II aldolase/adducin family protein n=1 Tax=Kribbella solani TaxID=236067 RepID=UPI0029A4E3CC|nr:class II aldolase/adducin family protein [Kribbella solani]MDX2972732.1 class II aldolase/adducin family protein [Kribbella solani]
MIGQPNDLDEARELLADACRVLYRLGLVDYMGHPSVRVPGSDLILIKPRHSTRIGAQDAIPPERMAVIDLDGRLIAGTDPPPGERFIHTAIYRARPDVGAIVHTHQPMATVMGIAGEPIQPILHVQSELVSTPVPVWECAKLVTDAELGADLAQALGTHRVCHLRGHGIVSVAESLPEAVINAIHLEQLAEASWRVRAMGARPRVIPPGEIEQRAATGSGWAVRWHYYLETTDHTMRRT